MISSQQIRIPVNAYGLISMDIDINENRRRINMKPTHTTYVVRISKSHIKYIYEEIPVEAYFEEICFISGNWERDIVSGFLA